MGLKKRYKDYAELWSPLTEDHQEDDPEMCCAYFGCGKKLTNEEKLYGNYCQSCQPKTPMASLITPYIYD
jgi:hypothetical protein